MSSLFNRNGSVIVESLVDVVKLLDQSETDLLQQIEQELRDAGVDIQHAVLGNCLCYILMS